MSKLKCKVKDICGGCQLYDDYSTQIEYKKEKINKILKAYNFDIDVIGASKPLNYRNKVQVTFGKVNNKVICGNYVKDSHIIVECLDCNLADEKINEIIKTIKALVIKYKISVFNEHTYKGCIRHVLIRSTSLNEYLVTLVTGSPRIYNEKPFVKELVKTHPEIKGVLQSINNKRTSMILGNKPIVLYGSYYVTDKLCGLKFQISAESFYQVNKTQTEVLYKLVKEFSQVKSNETILDAYCGTGTIGLTLAKDCKELIGVEINNQAIKDAIRNAKNNKIDNAFFVADDAGHYLKELNKKHKTIDLLIMDPPRTGSNKVFIDSVLKAKPKRIVYVSCNPETLKDNLKDLCKSYRIDKVKAVDMFPYTEHIETVVSLIRKDVY